MTSADAKPASLLQSRATLSGIGLMLFGILLFSVNDVMGKWLVATYSVGQVLLIRSVAALVILAPFICREGIRAILAMPNPGLQLLRAMLGTLEVALFYWAVADLPLADVMTYYLAGPIYVTALSPLLLGETVDRHRWMAAGLGFLGVLIALRPTTSATSLPALIALVGSLSFAFMMITTRRLRGSTDIALVTTQTVGALAFGCIAAPLGWVQPTARDLFLLALLGAISLAAHVCVNRSLKLAPASIVVPYQYTLIVWAVVFGWLVFGDVPPLATVLGAAIIVAAGLIIFMREQRLARAAPPDR